MCSFEANVSALVITYGKPVNLVVNFKATNGGLYTDRVEITFFDPQLNQQFAIVRAIKAIVGSKADYELLKPRAPYVPRTRHTRQEELEVIPGEAPPTLKAIPWVVKLPEAAIPAPLHSVLSKGSIGEVVRHTQSNFLPSTFESKTYARHFKHILWAEEYRSE
jgi:helicase MOV-10